MVKSSSACSLNLHVFSAVILVIDFQSRCHSFLMTCVKYLVFFDCVPICI